MMEYEEGGLSEQGGTVDPVSGNKVPPGALQEEVRDDIDARLSEGEFVFPADVVRYIGLEKLMKMRQQAKQGLAMMEDMGQMSNADEAKIKDTVSPDVFDMPDDMDVPAVMVAELEMAEGGDVQSERRYKSFRELMGTEGDKAEIITYVNDSGRKIIIMHLNGVPVSQVPDGFYPEGTDPPTDPTSPVEPPAPPQQRPKQPPSPEKDSGNEPPMESGATIVTGGYITDGKVVGGTKWNMSYNSNGSVTLKNSEFGEVTLSEQEATEVLGDKKRPSKNAFANIAGFGGQFFDRDGFYKQRQQNLSSGIEGNPGSGNAIHKSLIAKANAQQAGKNFVNKMGATSGFLGISTSDPAIADAVADALGKTPEELTDTDFQIVGSILSDSNVPGSTFSATPVTVNGQTVDPTLKAKIQPIIDKVIGNTFNMDGDPDFAAASGSMDMTTSTSTSSPYSLTGGTGLGMTSTGSSGYLGMTSDSGTGVGIPVFEPDKEDDSPPPSGFDLDMEEGGAGGGQPPPPSSDQPYGGYNPYNDGPQSEDNTNNNRPDNNNNNNNNSRPDNYGGKDASNSSGGYGSSGPSYGGGRAKGGLMGHYKKGGVSTKKMKRGGLASR